MPNHGPKRRKKAPDTVTQVPRVSWASRGALLDGVEPLLGPCFGASPRVQNCKKHRIQTICQAFFGPMKSTPGRVFDRLRQCSRGPKFDGSGGCKRWSKVGQTWQTRGRNLVDIDGRRVSIAQEVLPEAFVRVVLGCFRGVRPEAALGGHVAIPRFAKGRSRRSRLEVVRKRSMSVESGARLAKLGYSSTAIGQVWSDFAQVWDVVWFTAERGAIKGKHLTPFGSRTTLGPQRTSPTSQEHPGDEREGGQHNWTTRIASELAPSSLGRSDGVIVWIASNG